MDTFSSYNLYVGYIQARFFRTGVNTHLYLAISPGETGDGVVVKWIFSFKDLGSSHVISSEATVTVLEPTNQLCVNGVTCLGMSALEAVIFAGHYDAYVREMYEFEGISF